MATIKDAILLPFLAIAFPVPVRFDRVLARNVLSGFSQLFAINLMWLPSSMTASTIYLLKTSAGTIFRAVTRPGHRGVEKETPLPKLMRHPCLDDHRVVWISRDSAQVDKWLAGTKGGMDYWARANAFVLKKRRGEIIPSRVVGLKWEMELRA
ncbi:hypothetical protein B0H19DRAFT_1258991 [Mycena capillaripes]|nr:hypothetical protein B0H19DRAFT_1258991 [Mycena capillaripes]